MQTTRHETVLERPQALKVLDAVNSGMPRKEVARLLGISVPSTKRWLKQRRESSDVEPSGHEGGRA